MHLLAALTLSAALAQTTDEIVWEGSGPLHDARIVPLEDGLAFDLVQGQGLGWLLVPDGEHYRAVPRPPGLLFPTPEGPAIVQAGQGEVALHALWTLGSDGFEVVRDLPTERIEQATLPHALPSRGPTP
jgi:hypothetical protein